MSDNQQPPASSMSPELLCVFQTIPDESSEKTLSSELAATAPILKYQFQQEEGKKSSFVIDFSEQEEAPYVAWEKSAHIVIECGLGNNVHNDENSSSLPIPFLLGGLELVTNSRNMEVYLTKSNSSKEEYLMTCRGIPAPGQHQMSPHEQHHQWHKTLSVIPGGPRSVVKVHLKLLGLRPETTTHALLKSIKVKGRLPLIEDIPRPITVTTIAASSSTIVVPEQSMPIPTVPPHSAPTANVSSDLSTMQIPPPFLSDQYPTLPHAIPQELPQPPQQQHFHDLPTHPSPFSMQPDLGMAFLAGISNMLRATEDRMLLAIQTQVTRQVQSGHQQLAVLIANGYKTVLDEQQKLLQEQGQVIDNQGRILQQLESRQAQLITDVSNVKEELRQALQILQEQHEEGRHVTIDKGDDDEVHVDSIPKQKSVLVVASKDILDDDGSPQVQDDEHASASSSSSGEDGNDHLENDNVQEKDTLMEDLLQLLESETPTTPHSQIMNTPPDNDRMLWLPEPNIFLGAQNDITTSATFNGTEDNVEGVPHWLLSNTPEGKNLDGNQTWKSSSSSDGGSEDKIGSNDDDDNDDRGSKSQPQWVIGEATDDMVVIHGLSYSSLPLPESLGLQNECQESPRSDQSIQSDETSQKDPDSPTTSYKVRDPLLHSSSLDDSDMEGSDHDQHNHQSHFVHHHTTKSDGGDVEERLPMVSGVSSWKGAESEEDDCYDIAKYLERSCRSY